MCRPRDATIRSLNLLDASYKVPISRAHYPFFQNVIFLNNILQWRCPLTQLECHQNIQVSSSSIFSHLEKFPFDPKLFVGFAWCLEELDVEFIPIL